MARFQLLGATIHIGGDRDNTVVRDQFDPITFPEFVILRTLHGGADHVHSLVAHGHDERDPNNERERLALKYGEGIVSALFPGAMTGLPTEDPTIVTADELAAGETAAKAARTRVRKATPAPEPVSDPAPSKDKLPDLTK